MTLAATINGVRVVVPGVYSNLEVEDNLANIAPGARNIFIFGEAEKGVPGTLLNLSGSFFTDYESLKAFYGSGPLVDAARMIFQRQASAEFSGAVNQVYAFKTNASSLASRDLAFGGGVYGAVSAAEYGEDGNLISSQVQDAQVEILPSFTSSWVMKNEAQSLNLRVSGGAELTVPLAAEATPAELVSAVDALSGVSASGGAQLELISAAQVTASDTLSVTVDGTISSRITVTCSTNWDGADEASVLPGAVLYIPAASAIAGGSQENVGSYRVVSKTASTLVLDKISSSSAAAEVAPVQPADVVATSLAGDQTLASDAELMIFNPVTISVDAATDAGTGSGLEVYLSSGDTNIAQRWYASSFSNPVSPAASLSASVALSVSAGAGTFSISDGAYRSLPAVGSVLWVEPASVLAGPADENVGAWVVTNSGSSTISATKVVGPGASVSAVALAGQERPFALMSAIGSTSLGAKLHVSSAERKVRLLASRQSDGLAFPQASVGGRVVLEMGYEGTSATVSVTKAGRLQTTVSGGSGAALDIQLAKYSTMSDLIAFISSKTGYSARVSDNRYLSLTPRTILDQVDAASMATGHSANAYPARLKADYFDFTQLIADNFGLISFVEDASRARYLGLPDAESSNVFLDGGSAGATSNAEIAAALDAGLKIEVSQVIPLFSRDAAKDIDDGLTEPTSSYSIDSINSLVKSHVSTASTIEYKRERFGIVSFHGSFEDAQQRSSELASERMQMFFQLTRAVNSDGDVRWFLPWLSACAAAAGRVQAVLGTSLLRKSFQISDIKHIGDLSVFSDELSPDFDPDTRELDAAIEAGLAVLRPVTGFGIRMESPDLSTRSRQNDPKGWFFERINVQFVADEVLKTARTTLENFIGRRTTDVTTSILNKALTDILGLFVASGALRSFSIDSISLQGNTYKCTLSIFPTEAVEFITLDVLARRDVGDTV